jgi:signal recognition particle GTPase
MALDEGLTLEQMRGMLRLRHAQISQQLEQIQRQLLEGEVEPTYITEIQYPVEKVE